jgi:hypothetical protein
MIKWLHWLWVNILAIFDPKSNSIFTPKNVILEQMNEPRPLPMGKEETEEWARRIIAGAAIPGATYESQLGALMVMLMSLGPQEDHKSDGFFIKSLRKAAANEVASQIFQDVKKAYQEAAKNEAG